MSKNIYGLWPFLSLIAGAIVGYIFWLGQLDQYSDAPPPEWQRENSPVPYRESSLQGSENPAFGEWGLDFYRAIYPSNTNEQHSLSLTARIPKEGMLEVWYAAPPIRKRMGDRWLDICTMRSHQFPNRPNNHRPNQTTTTDPRCS